uniref:Uncharacterized protein n=1 Tax=Romanomermis culicivorax TaxID=13658 RepID=A0A915K934_ROMCU
MMSQVPRAAAYPIHTKKRRRAAQHGSARCRLGNIYKAHYQAARSSDRFVDGPQSVPSGYHPPGRGQHVFPMPQLGTFGLTTENHFTDGIVRTQTVVVDNGNNESTYVYRNIPAQKKRDSVVKCSLDAALPYVPIPRRKQAEL